MLAGVSSGGDAEAAAGVGGGGQRTVADADDFDPGQGVLGQGQARQGERDGSRRRGRRQDGLSRHGTPLRRVIAVKKPAVLRLIR